MNLYEILIGMALGIPAGTFAYLMRGKLTPWGHGWMALTGMLCVWGTALIAREAQAIRPLPDSGLFITATVGMVVTMLVIHNVRYTPIDD